jgi:hypothetical protein
MRSFITTVKSILGRFRAGPNALERLGWVHRGAMEDHTTRIRGARVQGARGSGSVISWIIESTQRQDRSRRTHVLGSSLATFFGAAVAILRASVRPAHLFPRQFYLSPLGSFIPR